MTTRPSNSGVIVALLPDEFYTRLRPSTTDHHLTVAFLGRYDHPALTVDAVEAFWETLSKVWTTKIAATVTAETVFDTPDGWAYVDLIDSPDLIDYRLIVQELLDVRGLPLSRDHGFMPHMTKRYSKMQGNVEMVHTKSHPQFTFDRAAVWMGDTRFEQELT